MRSRNIQPGEKISEYVHNILVIEYERLAQTFTLPLFANGSPTLLFNSGKGRLGKNSGAHLTLFGQTVQPEDLHISEGFTLIAYFFKPFALMSLFRISAPELTDKPIDLNLLSPQLTKTLQEQLLNAKNIEQRIMLLDDYILRLINQVNENNFALRYATSIIANQPGKDVLVNLQKELGITERSFQRMFEKNIGLSPNLFRRVCQFNAAFVQLNQKKYLKLSDIAFDHGYADQSHYIRAFREFTRLSPSDYLNYGS